MQKYDIAIPILPSRSVSDTLAFFRRLGFDGKICGDGDSYAILTRDAVEYQAPAREHEGQAA